MRIELRKKISYSLATVGLLAISAPRALAEAFGDGIRPQAGTSIDPTTSSRSLEEIIQTIGENIINIVAIILGVVATLYLIYNGYKYITAGGDTKKTAEARSGIINAVIGIIIIALAYTIINFALGASGTIGSWLS